MEILIVRHGSSHDMGEKGASRDADRTLSAAGQAEIQSIGKTLKILDKIPDKLFTSPLTRCEETSMGLLQASGAVEVPIELAPGLKPGATAMGIVGLLTSRASGAKRVCLVGHQPDLGKFISSLVAPEGLVMGFSPGSVALIDVEQPSSAWTGRLVWTLPPEAHAEISKGA